MINQGEFICETTGALSLLCCYLVAVMTMRTSSSRNPILAVFLLICLILAGMLCICLLTLGGSCSATIKLAGVA